MLAKAVLFVAVPKSTVARPEKSLDDMTKEEKKAHKALLAAAKKERKNNVKDMMQRLYPSCKVTLATADALGILTWKLQQNRTETLIF